MDLGNNKKWNYKLSESESNRITILKTLAIIFVVYLHSYSSVATFEGEKSVLNVPIWLGLLEKYISHVVGEVAVPLFFFLSAILLFRCERKYFKTIKGKIRTIIIPYLFWNTVGILIFIVLQNLPWTGPFFSGDSTPIMECTFNEWLLLYGIGTLTPKVYPLWFLKHLMIVTLFYPLIRKIVNCFPNMSLLAGIILAIIPMGIVFQTALAWFIIGACIVKKEIHMKMLDGISLKKMLCIYFLFSIMCLFYDNTILHNIFIVIGIIFWIRMSKKIQNNEQIYKVIQQIMPWIFVIYGFHEPMLSGVKKFCLKIFPKTTMALMLEYIFLPIIVIGICVCVGYIFKKIMPKLYLIAVGGR